MANQLVKFLNANGIDSKIVRTDNDIEVLILPISTFEDVDVLPELSRAANIASGKDKQRYFSTKAFFWAEKYGYAWQSEKGIALNPNQLFDMVDTTEIHEAHHEIVSMGKSKQRNIYFSKVNKKEINQIYHKNYSLDEISARAHEIYSLRARIISKFKQIAKLKSTKKEALSFIINNQEVKSIMKKVKEINSNLMLMADDGHTQISSVIEGIKELGPRKSILAKDKSWSKYQSESGKVNLGIEYYQSNIKGHVTLEINLSIREINPENNKEILNQHYVKIDITQNEFEQIARPAKDIPEKIAQILEFQKNLSIKKAQRAMAMADELNVLESGELPLGWKLQ